VRRSEERSDDLMHHSTITKNLLLVASLLAAPAMADRSTSKDALQTMRKQVTFFIRKQLFNEFMWKATDVASCFSDPNKTYYPAKKEVRLDVERRTGGPQRCLERSDNSTPIRLFKKSSSMLRLPRLQLLARRFAPRLYRLPT